MDLGDHDRVHGYATGDNSAHPPSLRPAYVLEATPPQPWVTPSLAVPTSATPLNRSRSIMYKARIHDFLIYASLIISVVALVMANRSSGGGTAAGKADGMAEKVKDLVQVAQPVTPQNQQINQPEAIIHLKFPSYPPPLTPSPISPIQKFLAYIHPNRRFQPPIQAYEITYDDLYRLHKPFSRLSPSELLIADHLLRDHAEFVSHDEKTTSILLRRLLRDLEHDFDPDMGHDHPHSDPPRHHGRLHSILELVRGDKTGHQTRLERERKLTAREKDVGAREKEVVDALNRLAKEREKE